MADRVYIFDTTLRDGEQSPGCSMTVAEKLRMAAKLVELGVDILEAGFPIASQGDSEAVDAVAREFPWSGSARGSYAGAPARAWSSRLCGSAIATSTPPKSTIMSARSERACMPPASSATKCF